MRWPMPVERGSALAWRPTPSSATDNCNSSPLPIKPFLDSIAALKISPNFALFVGQGTIRDQVIGPINRKATDAELEKMREQVQNVE